ncbi:MAG: hypothetical protein DRJ32_00390 [Thermoprotei archaeon]|nr:MAG: hypothetical protein B6U94_00950 [Thermofilum sp. ex4484_79]RLE61767.1 MAG: hypothetical protein DRJ32_00390 [Thermoprotei archaeon]
MPIYIPRGKLAIPGDIIAEGAFKSGSGTYRINNRVYSAHIGIVDIDRENRMISVKALKSVYVPKKGDIVIGKVVEVGITSWIVDIASPWPGVLQIGEALSRPIDISKADLKKYLNIGDIIVAKIIEFDLTRDPLLTVKESKLGIVKEGALLEFPFYYIEKISAKLHELSRKLQCNVIQGANGRIVIVSKNKDVEVEAIKTISRIISAPSYIRKGFKPKKKYVR